MITCNIITSFPHRIARQLKTHLGYFDRIRIVVTEHDDSRIEDIIKRYDSHAIQVINAEWSACDNVRNELCKYLTVGEWALIIDDDDILSQSLLDNLYETIDDAERLGRNSILFTFINEIANIDNSPIYPDVMLNGYATRDFEQLREYLEENKHYQWFAIRGYKINENIGKWVADQHPAFEGYTDYYFCPYPIIHIKRFFDPFITPIWIEASSLMLSPSINYLGDVDAGSDLLGILKSFPFKISQYNLIKYLKNGNIDTRLKEWMWKYVSVENYHISCWFIIYYLHYHPEELPSGYINKELFKQYFWRAIPEGIRLLPTERTPINVKLKEHLLKMGIKEIDKYGTFY